MKAKWFDFFAAFAILIQLKNKFNIIIVSASAWYFCIYAVIIYIYTFILMQIFLWIYFVHNIYTFNICILITAQKKQRNLVIFCEIKQQSNNFYRGRWQETSIMMTSLLYAFHKDLPFRVASHNTTSWNNIRRLPCLITCMWYERRLD